MVICFFNLQHTLVLKVQPEQHISNIFIYLDVSDQSVYIRSEEYLLKEQNYNLPTCSADMR